MMEMGDLPHETPRPHGSVLLRRAAERLRRDNAPGSEELADLFGAINAAYWPASSRIQQAAERAAEAFLSDPGDPPAGVA